MIKSPFKFLDSYSLEDRNTFFGRDQEITDLFRKVLEGKILLVYGISGTGKSSLVNCGLASRFDQSDWLPINVRRGANIIDSLNEAVNRHAITSLKKTESFVDKIQSLYLDHFKPVFLIFDQFEELFIFGSPEEKKEFLDLIKSVVRSRLNCNVIFVIREEFLAGMTEFDYDLPEIFSNRYRVEKMKKTNAISAIEGPCKVNGVEVEQGFSEELINKLTPSGTDVELTYLQIYLDRIFKLASEGKTGTQGLVFSNELLTKAGSVSDLLGQFLDEQIRQLDDPNTGMSILKSFVSIQGTKRQMNEQEILNAVGAFGTIITEPGLLKYLAKFVDLRILRERDEVGHFELRHDSLASKIYEKFTAIEKDIVEVRQFIDNAYSVYEKRGKLLSGDDLKYIAPYEDNLYLSKLSEAFIDRSKNEITTTRRRRRTFAGVAGIALIIVLSGFTIWALRERKNALYQQATAIDSKNKALESEKRAVTEKNNAVQSEQLAEAAKNLAAESEKNSINERNNAISEARRARLLLLVSKAKESLLNDPTKAIRYAQLAYEFDNGSALANHILNQIFYESESNPFYSFSLNHISGVNSVNFSPDGRKIITASHDNTAKVWDQTGKCLLTLSGHSGPLAFAIFSPDGTKILTGSGDMEMMLWDLKGKCIKVFKCLGSLYSATFSSDGKHIISYSFGESIQVWDISGKNLINYHNLHTPSISPDGKKFAACSNTNSVKIIEINGNILDSLIGHSAPIVSIVYSPNGKLILTSSKDKTAKVWDIEGKCIMTLTGHSQSLTSGVFSPDGEKILTTSTDKTIKLWNLFGQCLNTFIGHSESVSNVLFSPGGEEFLSISYDNTAKLWNLSGTCKQTYMGHQNTIHSACFSPDGKLISTASADNTAKVWNRSNNYYLPTFKHENRVRAATFSKNNRNIVTVSDDTTAKIWDLKGICLHTLRGHKEIVVNAIYSPDNSMILTSSYDNAPKLWDTLGNCLTTFQGHKNYTPNAVFSPDGKNVLTSSFDGTVKLWNLSGECLLTIRRNISINQTAVFSLDGKNILTHSRSNNILIYDLKGKCLDTLSGHTDRVGSINLSPNGKYILTPSSDKTAKLWDYSGKCLVTFSGHRDNVLSAVFSNNCKFILTASADGTSKLWDFSGQCILTLSGNRSSVFISKFSRDDKIILTASADNSVKLWNLDGECFAAFNGHNNDLTSACFSPDGKYILTSSFDKTAKLWIMPNEIYKWVTSSKMANITPSDMAEIGVLDDFNKIKNSDNLSLITEYADWYWSIQEISKAEILYLRALEINPMAIDKRILGDYYKGLKRKDKYLNLYKDNPEIIIKDELALLGKESGGPSYTEQCLFLKSKAILLEKLININPSDQYKKDAVENYNNLCFYSLYNKQFNEGLKAVQRGIEIDSTYEYLFTNLPLCYLLTDQFDKAKPLYIQLKDRPMTIDPIFKTFRDAFLADFEDLESKGILHADFVKIKELLKNN